MPAERRDMPDWARRERQSDLNWIQENLDVFQMAARVAYEGTGRGAIVADTTTQLHEGSGNPFAYFSQEQVEEYEDEEINRLVRQYDPKKEFVVLLLKSRDRTSAYRIRPQRHTSSHI